MRADARRNRDRIVEVARMLFRTKGYDAVSMDEVSKTAEVGTGTLYRHFPTKEALLEAVLVTRVEAVLEDARGGATADDPGAAFFGFLEIVVDMGTKKHDLAEALSRAGVDVEARATPLWVALQDAVQVLLVRAQEAGAVRRDIGMPELFGLIRGTCMVGQYQDPNVCSAGRLLSIVCDGLRPPSARQSG